MKPPYQPPLLELLNQINTGVVLLRADNIANLDFTITYVNETNSKIVGIDFSPFVNRPLRESFPEAYNHGLPEAYAQALRTGEKVPLGEMEYGDDHVTKKRWFLEVIPVDESHVALTTENVSALTEAKRDLEKHGNILQRKNKELEQLAYTVSHDLKSPLNNILGWIDLLASEDVLPEEFQEPIKSLAGTTHRMKELIEDILEFSLLGQKAKALSDIDLEAMIKGVVSDVENERAMITVGKFPTVRCYPVELRQLIQNLVTNAIKFVPNDRTPSVSINYLDDEGYHHISVTDNGMGIREQDKTKVFGVFSRLVSNSEYEGTGIGLANCKKIADMHDGEISITSTVGVGSTFRFRFPKNLMEL